jgi:AmmeMemoRadiSam system protein B
MYGIRPPARAGLFYDKKPEMCKNRALSLLEAVQLPNDLHGSIPAGLAPHAGWMYSGALAMETIAALMDSAVGTVVIFGSDHTGAVRMGEVYDSGAWSTPLGDCPIDEELAAELVAGCGCLRSNPDAHAMEHSIEVLIPLLQTASENVKIVPIGVPVDRISVEIGQYVGQVLATKGGGVKVLGSTDLTHHGGHFGSLGGSGPASESFASQNDRRLLDLIEHLDTDRIIPEVRSNGNACGGGAVAATMAAAREMGAERGRVLSYTNSYRIVHERSPWELDDTTVGYASVIFC